MSNNHLHDEVRSVSACVAVLSLATSGSILQMSL